MIPLKKRDTIFIDMIQVLPLQDGASQMMNPPVASKKPYMKIITSNTPIKN